MLRTAERFKDTKLPAALRDAILQRFPKWMICQDVYQVHYYDRKDKADKVFKVLLENGDKRMKAKLNEQGGFI